MILMAFQDFLLFLTKLIFLLSMIATHLSLQSWTNEISNTECRPLKAFTMSSLGDIASYKGSRSDCIAVIIYLLDNFTVGP